MAVVVLGWRFLQALVIWSLWRLQARQGVTHPLPQPLTIRVSCGWVCKV